jgi:hypothetical protein
MIRRTYQLRKGIYCRVCIQRARSALSHATTLTTLTPLRCEGRSIALSHTIILWVGERQLAFDPLSDSTRKYPRAVISVASALIAVQTFHACR